MLLMSQSKFFNFLSLFAFVLPSHTLTSGPRRLLAVSQRHDEVGLGQRLMTRRGGEQRRLDDVVGGGRRGADLAELAGEVWRAETAIGLQADAAVLTEQRTED